MPAAGGRGHRDRQIAEGEEGGMFHFPINSLRRLEMMGVCLAGQLFAPTSAWSVPGCDNCKSPKFNILVIWLYIAYETMPKICKPALQMGAWEIRLLMKDF